MRKTDEGLRQHESPMFHLVAISAVVLIFLALVAFGLLDDVIRILGL
jgi:succinate dehydrogenase hydrophobic anchor subunit